MSHEQSETIQLKNGKWTNVYGEKTKKAGQRLPGEIEYNTVDEAVSAAKKRSKSFDKSNRHSTLLNGEESDD